MKLPQKKLTLSGGSIYKVYKNDSEFETVEAATATEALEKTEVENPVKVAKAEGDMSNILVGEELTLIEEESTEEDAALASEGESATDAPAEGGEAAPEAEPEAPAEEKT